VGFDEAVGGVHGAVNPAASTQISMVATSRTSASPRSEHVNQFRSIFFSGYMIFPMYFTFAWTLSSTAGPKISGHSTAVIRDNLYLFGGLLGSAGSAVSNRFYIYDGMWKEIAASGPSERMYSAAAELDNNFYIFGGWDPGEAGSGGMFKNDVWKFDTSTNLWEELDTLPEPVSRHGACRVNDKIVISTFRNTLVFEKDRVRVQETTGDPPTGLSMCACTALNDEFVVFGGTTRTQEMSNDVYVLNTTAWEWRKLVANGAIPTKRASASVCPINTTTCIVHGGGHLKTSYDGGKGLQGLDDLFLLKLSEKNATWIKLNESTTENRVASSLDLVDNVPVLHGGWNPQTKETYRSTHIFCAS
jgi:hypothetical protein